MGTIGPRQTLENPAPARNNACMVAGVDKNSGLVHSVVVTAANLHDLTPTAELLEHPGKRRARPDTAEGRVGRDGQSSHPRQGKAPISGDQAAVRLPQSPAAGHGQKPLQGEDLVRSYQPVLFTARYQLLCDDDTRRDPADTR